MHDAITDVPGIEVGHATDADALTGCTAVVCRAGAVAGVAVRGAAPGTRETDLCRPGTLVERAHAVAAVRRQRVRARGGVGRRARSSPPPGSATTPAASRVPIVPAAVIFDLSLGAVAWPDVEAGRRAVGGGERSPPEQGCVGAGTGATVGKVLGMARATKGGIGTASATPATRRSARSSPSTRAATSSTRRPARSSRARARRQGGWADSVALVRRGFDPPPPVEQSTIAVVATDAPLTVEQANHLASVAHDGLARTIRPVHTMHDGDTIFALATGAGDRPAARSPAAVTRLAVFAVDAVERATLAAVRHATPLGGLPAAGDGPGA